MNLGIVNTKKEILSPASVSNRGGLFLLNVIMKYIKYPLDVTKFLLISELINNPYHNAILIVG